MSFWRKSKPGTELAIPSQKTMARELGKSAHTAREANAEPVKLTRVNNDVSSMHVLEMDDSKLVQHIKDLRRRDGENMSKWSWELHAAHDEYRTRRQLREMDTKVKLAKGELQLGELEVDRLHEKIDEDGLRMVRDGQTANVPKRRR